MAKGEKVPYGAAYTLASEFILDIDPYCCRVEIAGSLRRQEIQVSDIEICCIPLYDIWLDSPIYRIEALTEKVQKLCRGRIWNLLKNGSAYKQLETGLCNIDLFITTLEKWGVIFTLRTGPADFSHRLVTKKAHGGLCPAYLKFEDGRIKHVVTRNVYETPTEETVFKLLELDYIPPMRRR